MQGDIFSLVWQNLITSGQTTAHCLLVVQYTYINAHTLKADKSFELTRCAK